MLLIHDDADNCQPDICAAAAELRAADITAHVVGLGVKPDDMAKMACLPLTTGGRHFNAQNAEQVAGFVEEALLLSASEMGGVQSAAASPPVAAIVPPQPVPASGPPALHLRALLAPNTEPLATPLYWTVAAEAQPDLLMFGARAVNPDGSRGARPIHRRGTGWPGIGQTDCRGARQQTRSGHDAAQRRHHACASPVPQDLDTIAGCHDHGNRCGRCARAGIQTGEAVALVPAGRHLVRAELGLVRAEQAVTVTAGRLFAVDMPLNAGRLQLTTVGRDGAAGLEAPIFSVVEDDPDAPGGRREVARSAAQPAEFVLPPGTYYVIARQGAVEARERLAIGPGDVDQAAFDGGSRQPRLVDQAAALRRGSATRLSPTR